ncbi:MAG: DegT/DnrJ/EryC1/StrS family aminotransferase, partial [Desulfobacterales bacterium]|nr:DegT/DnrJ/EryC1/StrS family aminotransferase [Desulfobacterales bacterium]
GEIDETLCLDPDRLEDVVTARTRAILPVHMCGSMARIDEIAQFCARKGLVLIEDACQALGAVYQGKALGAFGQMGCFSFDPVKTITCGEGGAVITDDAGLYEKAHSYADHGHEHVGSDRGLEGHPILGTNHRISELNAAVGLAQLRKLDRILEVQRANKTAIKEALTTIPGLTFRKVPDENGDSATFLSFLLSSEDRARQAALDLGRAGVDGCFYWYDNNWHYLRRWEHLKKMASAFRLPQTLTGHCPDYDRVHLPQSDNIIKRLISMQIKLSWTEADLARRIEKTRRALGA